MASDNPDAAGLEFNGVVDDDDDDTDDDDDDDDDVYDSPTIVSWLG